MKNSVLLTCLLATLGIAVLFSSCMNPEDETGPWYGLDIDDDGCTKTPCKREMAGGGGSAGAS
jgi:hypothetical protein